jgi:hypothetical protein
MDKKTIGTNAGIIWNLLNNGQKWNCKKLMEDSGLSKGSIDGNWMVGSRRQNRI